MPLVDPAPPPLDEDRVLELLVRNGLAREGDTERLRPLAREVVAAQAVGFDAGDFDGLLQAYSRALGRIAGADAEVAARWLERFPDDEREAAFTTWLDRMMPIGTLAFDQLHRPRVEELVRRRGPVHHDELPRLAVAFVDLRGSTHLMAEGDATAIRDLADDLYFAAQEVAVRCEVTAAKYLGDGVVLVTASRERMLHAVRQAVEQVSRRTPLPAGAGVAYGPVIRRAGDVFGFPVNLAARLAELAPAGEVLADAQAVPDDVAVRRWMEVLPRGLLEHRRTAVL